MSMILDALSRAEQERRSEEGIVLDPSRYVGSSSIKEERLKKWIFIALLVNIALALIILISYLWQDNTNNASAQVNTVDSEVVAPSSVASSSQQAIIEEPVTQIVSNRHNAPPLADKADAPMLSLQEEAKVNKKVVPVVAEKKKIKNAVKVKKNPPVRYAPQPLSKPDNVSSVSRTANPTTRNDKTYYTEIDQLSALERSKLNQYEINVHVFDNNVQNRFVLINMTKYKEGDRLPGGGPLIAAITPEGVILDTGSGKTLLERN